MQFTDISRLLEQHKPGFAMAQEFYRDLDIYQVEINEIFMKSWLYAGHVSEIPNGGDYLLFDFADESVIIIRDGEGELHGLLNVCRHRGSRVCLEARGHANRLVCPYHAWTYGLDGSLKNARTMPESFDIAGIALKKVHLKVLAGMIFINFMGDPATFKSIEEEMTVCLEPYGLENARVAHRQSYPIDANWKLAVENYSECYHCAPAHPEYSRGHSLALPEARSTEKLAEVMARAQVCGLSEKVVDKICLDAAHFGADCSYERYPMLRGHVTGSKDGKPVAPLLGSIREFDGGATDFQVGPVTFALAYCDHVVLYRFTPLSADKCDCDITWLVNGDAEEGKDFDKADVTWLWDVTTNADKKIIENNQKGVNSRFYEPGPYSEMEDVTRRFVAWYLDTIKKGVASA